MWYMVIIVFCFLANPVVFLMSVLACAILCSPIVLYLWWLAREDKKEWAAKAQEWSDKRAERHAEEVAANKIKASEMWGAQVEAYSRGLPASMGKFEDKSFPAPKCFSNKWDKI